MTAIATPAATAELFEQYSDYDARDAAIFEPEFGSTLGHVGHDALDLLHRLTTNSLLDLEDGEARRTVLTNEKGRIIDVIWVLRRSELELLLVSDAPESGPMRQGIERFTIIEDAELNDLTASLKRWYVFGPGATRLVGELLPELDLTDSEIGSVRALDRLDGGVVLALRTDAAGPESWLLIVGQPAVSEITDRITRWGLSPASEELFDFVRISNTQPIAGKESSEEINPLEAGLMHVIDFDKGCYVGQEVIARLDTYDKVQRSLVRFTLADGESDEATVSEKDRIVPQDGGRDVGWVTSVARDPRTSQTVGLAILRKAYNADDVPLVTDQGAPITLLRDRDQ